MALFWPFFGVLHESAKKVQKMPIFCPFFALFLQKSLPAGIFLIFPENGIFGHFWPNLAFLLLLRKMAFPPVLSTKVELKKRLD